MLRNVKNTKSEYCLIEPNIINDHLHFLKHTKWHTFVFRLTNCLATTNEKPLVASIPEIEFSLADLARNQCRCDLKETLNITFTGDIPPAPATVKKPLNLIDSTAFLIPTL